MLCGFFSVKKFILMAFLLCLMSKAFCAQYDFDQPLLNKVYSSPNQVDIANNGTYTSLFTKLSFESDLKNTQPIQLSKKSLQPLQKNTLYKSLLLRQGDNILKTTGGINSSS